MILIIGGTGFIGKNLLVELVRQGYETTVVSRHPDQDFLLRHGKSSESTTTELFLADPASALIGCKAVVYLASSSTPGANLEAPWRDLELNVEPAMRIMQAVARHSDAHFIFLSSGGAIYGHTDSPEIPEDSALNPISPYGLGKQMIEAAIGYTARSSGLRSTILRAANPIGRWQKSRSQGLVGVLMRASLTGEGFHMIGDGSAIRDYFDVQDLVAAILAVIDAGDKTTGQIWNVGSGRGLSTCDMINLVQQITGVTLEVTQLPPRASDVDSAVVDIRAIKAAIGWEPQIAIETSLSGIWQDLNRAADV